VSEASPVLDAHAHFFSRAFYVALAEQSRVLRNRSLTLQELEARTGVEVPGEDPGELARRWVPELDRHDVSRSVMIASIPGDEASVLDAAAESSGRIIPYAMFDPTREGAGARLREAAARGLRGVCLFPAMHHFRADESRTMEFLGVARDCSLVVFVHCGLLRLGLRDRLGLPSPFDLRYSSPLALCRAAQTYPGLPFTIPHFGSGMFREALLLARQCDNVFLDTSSENTWVVTQPGRPSIQEVFAQALDAIGPERLLFGSDSSVFPRGYRGNLLAAQRQILEDLGLSATDRDRILGGNLARLLEVPV
jgi:predicted TIM-barrel fold metal-dependent hydrolase